MSDTAHGGFYGDVMAPVIGAGGALADLAETGHSIYEIGHTADHFAPFLQPTLATAGNQAAMLQHAAAGSGGFGLGNVLGPLALWSGIQNLSHANTDSAEGMIHGAEGILQTTAGGIGTLGLAGGLTSSLGATGAGGSMLAASSAAAPVAAVAGAGAAGLAVGTGMYNASNSEYTRTGLWGQDESGRNRSAADWGSNWGNSLDAAIGTRPGDWSVPGAIASMTGGVVGGVAGTAQAGWNYLFGD